MLFKNALNHVLIAYIPFYKQMAWAFLHLFQVFEVPGVCEFIKVYYFITGVFFDHIADKVASYKTCPACYKDVHSLSLPCFHWDKFNPLTPCLRGGRPNHLP